MHACLALIAAFVDERLSANEFEAVYLALFKNDPGGRPEPIYEVLDTLLGDVDAYDESRSRAVNGFSGMMGSSTGSGFVC